VHRLRTLVPILIATLGCSAPGPGDASAFPGDLDPTFGGDGTVVTDFGGEDQLNEVALQPDGRIVAVGTLSGRILSARYNPDGSLDPGYGGDGTVVTSIGSGGAREVAVQPDGRILVVGTTSMAGAQDIVIVRYLPDGSLDPTLAGDGSTVVDFGVIEQVGGLALAPNGSFYVGVPIVSGGEEDLAVAGFLPDGSLDPGFGAGGGAAVDLGFEERVEDVALQIDGKLVATGIVDYDPGFDQLLVRLNPDGSPDPSFDGDGIQVTDQGGFEAGGSIAVQGDGRIVVGGIVANASVEEQASLARYLPDGSLDPALAGDGFTVVDVGGGDAVRDLAIQPDGKLVLAAGPGFGAVRLTTDGLPDPEFGLGGATAVDLGTGARESAVAIQPDGAILVAGTLQTSPGVEDFALARFAGGDPVRCQGRLATIVATPGVRTTGTDAADVILGADFDAADRIRSGKGRDRICSLAGKDVVNSGPGRDLVLGAAGRDVLRGAGGRDVLRGGAGNDTLVGGGGRDTLVGGKGARDRCKTRPGSDRTRGC
jgi:uncharacterized delta-60 repeat protein